MDVLRPELGISKYMRGYVTSNSNPHHEALAGGWNVATSLPLSHRWSAGCIELLNAKSHYPFFRALKQQRLVLPHPIQPLCSYGSNLLSGSQEKETSAAEETLELLEWPRVCKAVAEFADTDLGKERIRVLVLPDSKEDSEILLSETYAAVFMNTTYGGAFSCGVPQTSLIKHTLEKIRKGYVVSGLEAVAVGKVLQVSQSLKQSVDSCSRIDRSGALQPLLRLVSPLGTYHDLIKVIEDAVDDHGFVKDEKHSELKQARIQERSIELKLRQLLRSILQEKTGIAASDQVVNVDGRLCLALSSELWNKVSGILLRSNPSGTIGYFEPTTVMSLNNKLNEARALVIQAEYNVLLGLVKKILPFIDDITTTLNIIVSFDVIMARAKYSSWMGATRPTLVNVDSMLEQWEENTGHAANLVDDVDQVSSHNYIVQLRSALHPLLAQQHREGLKEAKLGLKLKEKMLARLHSRAVTRVDAVNEMESSLVVAKNKVAALEAAAPRAVNILVKRKTRVVTITGPNTGGKTVTMKTLGLAALMAKAGLYVLASEPVYMPWFDNVYADIGDQQSLQQSLSTFSGHLLRIKRIRAESTGHSLVLLDEVGAGTESTQGAALGMALLESLAESDVGGSLLTVATTHHPELKMLKYRDNRFENACMEFDEHQLKPTYKLLWGIPGRSNALIMAERLGLPKKIVEDAHSMLGVDKADLNQIILDLEQTRMNFQHDVALGAKLLSEAKCSHRKLIAATKELDEFSMALQLSKISRISTTAAVARSTLHRFAREAKQK
ncbi:hypothetical protein O6H91_04G118400 [Diphasiastrum complanatum]|uniref:Uncharacterized protein n=1 Tax=Diphasiastrum complanatum TaxID=34168 RepID=A0ACC2E0S5_DIPCM|nr:hypothetical protein O6H91_04G118400 [Diphasiastrum complanatum]